MKEIYVIINPNDNRRQVKVGETVNWINREKQYRTSGFAPQVLHHEYNCSFGDDDIKKILVNDFDYKINTENGDEWYTLKDNETNDDFVEKVKAIITHLKTGESLNLKRTECFSMRDEQKECVEKTYDAFENKKFDRFLWNCKMRFGKTFTTYQLVKKAQYKQTLVITWKVAVESSWKNDLLSHVDFKGYNFIEKTTLNTFDINKTNVVFLSIPLLLFNKSEGEIERDIEEGKIKEELIEENIGYFKDKLKNVANVNWDLLVVDEAHYGTRAKQTEKILKMLNFKRKLELSGTPFKIMADAEYADNQIYNWTYNDEQKKKKEYEYLGDKNPYKDLPDMNIYTYHGVEEMLTVDNNYDFNLNDLFKTKNGEFFVEDNTCVEGVSNKENLAVKKIIDFMCGERFDLVEKRDIKESNVVLPYFQDMVEKNKKSLWFLPSVDAVCAMEKLLNNHKFFKDYCIINATGKGEGSSKKSLDTFIEMEKEKDKIICLSCGMLNTGVTIKTLNSVVVLQNKKSAQDFFQSIFRCQSPCKGKTECYVFDFNPKKYFDNFLDYVKSNNKIKKKGNDRQDKNDKKIINDEKQLVEELMIKTFMYLDGDMKNTTYDEIMSYVSLNWDPEKIKKILLRSNNISLDKLINADENILKIIDSIPFYKNEKKQKKKETKGTGGTGGKPPKGKDEEEKKKKYKYDIRKAKLNILLASLSMFIYITNAEEQNLLDIIKTKQRDLFKKICFIDIADFEKLYENEFFKNEILSKAIYKFYREETTSRNWSELIRDRVIGDV